MESRINEDRTSLGFKLDEEEKKAGKPRKRKRNSTALSKIESNNFSLNDSSLHIEESKSNALPNGKEEEKESESEKELTHLLSEGRHEGQDLLNL